MKFVSSLMEKELSFSILKKEMKSLSSFVRREILSPSPKATHTGLILLLPTLLRPFAFSKLKTDGSQTIPTLKLIRSTPMAKLFLFDIEGTTTDIKFVH